MKPIDIQRNQLINFDNYDGNASFQYEISPQDTINQINNEDISSWETGNQQCN